MEALGGCHRHLQVLSIDDDYREQWRSLILMDGGCGLVAAAVDAAAAASIWPGQVGPRLMLLAASVLTEAPR